MSYFDFSGFANPPVLNPISYDPAQEGQYPGSAPSFPGGTQALAPFDPTQALRANEDATRYALAQRLGILAPNNNVMPLPDDQQQIINQRADMIRSTLGPGPLERNYIQQLNTAFAGQPQHGFKARLAGFGKGLLMGEGLPGAIRGAADPTTMSLRYKLSQLQPLFGGVQQEQQFAGATLGRAKQLGELTGYDPMTGLPTPKYDYQMNYLGPAAMQRAQTSQQRANDYGRSVTNQNETRNARVDIARLNAQLRGREKGGVLSQDEIIDIESQFGIRLPANYNPQSQEIKIDENGKYILINKATAQVTPTGATSMEPQKEANKEKRAKIIADDKKVGRDLQKRDVDRREGLAQLDIEKEVNKKFPYPEGFAGRAPSKEKLDTWKKNQDTYRTELQQTIKPSASNTLAAGDTYTGKVRQDPSTGKKYYEKRKADGTLVWEIR